LEQLLRNICIYCLTSWSPFAPVTPVSGAESAARHSQPRHLVLDRRMALMPRRACSESGSEKTRAHLGRELRRHHLYHFQDAMRGFDFPVRRGTTSSARR
jgi:hypothetical protein